MPLDEGFNFRASSGYVTDPADTQFVDGSTTYPTTANGVTFGWVTTAPGANERDRSNSVDARLAGIHFASNSGSGQLTFRVDLAATGDHEIRAAFGDATTVGVANTYAQFKDNGSPFATIDKFGTSFTGPQWIDATDVLRTSAADWVANNAALSRTFTSTVFEVTIGQPVFAAGNTHISHLRVTEIGGGAAIALQGDDLAHAMSFDGATLAQTHLLAGADLAHVTAFDAGSLAQTHLLAAQDLAHLVALDGATLAQTHLLAIDDLVDLLALDGAAVAQTHLLVIDSLDHLHELEASGFVAGIAVAADNLVHATALDGGSFAQTHLLQIADLVHLASIDAAVLDQIHLFAADGLVLVSDLGPTALDQTHLLAVLDLVHELTLGTAGFADQVLPGGLCVAMSDGPLLETDLGDSALLETDLGDSALLETALADALVCD